MMTLQTTENTERTETVLWILCPLWFGRGLA